MTISTLKYCGVELTVQHEVKKQVSLNSLEE